MDIHAIIVVIIILIGYLISSVIIDLITIVFAFLYKIYIIIFNVKKKLAPLSKDAGISIIIPAYNEEKHIEKVIRSSFNQTVLPEKVIVINDNSTDKTAKICKKLKKEYKNLIIINQKKNKGKAFNITYALKKIKLSEFTIVQDADTFISKNYLENIIKPFRNRRVVIVTGLSLPFKQHNFFGKVIYNGSIFLYKFFSFRKKAQSFRNSISVVTGDSAAYRTSFLKEVGGLPKGTQTEDMDIAWIALEKGYRIVYQPHARANSIDAGTFKGHWRQITRWYAGGFQGLFKHNKKLLKAKPLLLTTLIPTFLDSSLYSFSFLMALLLLPIFPVYSIGFFASDLIFTILAIIFFDFKRLLHVFEIYFIKIIWSFAWIFSGTKTLIEFLGGKRYWGGTWKKEGYYKEKK